MILATGIIQVFLLLLSTSQSFSVGSDARRSVLSLPKSANERSTALLAASSAQEAEAFNGEASISKSTFNLAKSIIGAGVLSLPSAVAFVSDTKAALLPSSILCTLFGLVAAYSFSMIGKACDKHKAKSFQDVWSKSISPKSAWIISGSVTCMCFLASIAYSIIIGDSFSAIFRTLNFPALLTQRSNVILLLTSIFVLPLCLLKSLNALAPFSLLGLGGTLYTAVFMAIRLFDKSYGPGGKFVGSVAAALQPSFNKAGPLTLDYKVFVLVSMLSTSFIAHYNAPSFYAELKDATVAKFNKVVTNAFVAAIALFLGITSFGFLTFGGNAAGFVLNNYSGADVLATAARIAVGGSIITGYPFTFSAFRDGVLDLLQLKGQKRDQLFRPVAFALLSLVTGLALSLKDVGFVLSLSGALFGSLLMFIVPAMMNLADTKGEKTSGFGAKLEKVGSYSMIVTGILMIFLGVGVSVLKEMGKL